MTVNGDAPRSGAKPVDNRASSAPVSDNAYHLCVIAPDSISSLSRLMTQIAERRMTWTAFSLLPLSLRRQALFTAHHKRLGHLKRPKTFNEKVNWRILYDRREILAWTCDKIRVKALAQERGIRAVPTLWAGTDVRELRDLDLPAAWVLKPNNRTGLVFFGQSQCTDVEPICQLTETWKSDNRVIAKGEWAYTRAAPGFLVEERIGPVPGSPTDFKVFVFDDAPYMVQVDLDRFGHHQSRFYRPNWQPMLHRDRVPVSGEIARPHCLGEMLEAATTVAKGFDFLRVDMYIERDQVFLGEVTPYPGGGLEPFEPRSADLDIGNAWRLPQLSGA